MSFKISSRSNEEETMSVRGEVHIGDDINPDDVMKIFLATDIHLGYKECDGILGDDTFRTFEEILQLAKESDADMLLLGGDLFHEARPSPSCLLKCLELLKKYCLGDRPIYIEMLTDLKGNATAESNEVLINYEDPNMNFSLPVLSIHGNHDDPTGHKHTSALDVISSTGLVNYFGRWESHTEINVKPLLLRKGCTNLALYGLSHIKDERLGRLYLNGKVHFQETPDNWFKFLVWHQNRAHRGTKNYIRDDNLPSFLDLVLWGHEHDCRIQPEEMPNNVFITQPGSPVATSLSLGESLQKHVGLLKIHKTTFELQPIALHTVRPFIYDELVLEKPSIASNQLSADAQNQVTTKVISMIEMAKERSVDLLPLIRLQVRYLDEQQVFNTIRFGNDFEGKVANTLDMIKCTLLRSQPQKREKVDITSDDKEFVENAEPTRLEDLVLSHFEKHPSLQCISSKGMTEAVSTYVLANNTDAVKVYLNELSEELLRKLDEKSSSIEEIDDVICHTKIKIDLDTKRKADCGPMDVETIEISGSDEEESGIANTSVRARRGRARGGGTATRSRGRGRGRAKAN